MAMKRIIRGRVQLAPLSRGRKFLGASLMALATLMTVMVGSTGQAAAAVVQCNDVGYKYCASVTSISSGSCLRQHLAPDYGTSGHTNYSNNVCWTNGEYLDIACWTTGAPDADGHNDRYWFFTVSRTSTSINGYVNDWYLNTGTYSQWSRIISYC
jgi:hypothetical protein